jgi:ABC-type glycerol-3-phosphate transport system substrate-binding protein
MELKMTRRELLKLAAVTTGGLILVACGADDSGTNSVRIMVDSWALAYAPFQAMAEKYNALHPEGKIKVEPSPGGWQTKVSGQIRSKELQWAAAGVMTSMNDLAGWIQLQLIQPIDVYLAASTQEGAKEFLSDMLPALKEDNSYEGKMYGIPFSVENINFQWNNDWFTKAGVTQAPGTWQELFDACKAVKQYLVSQGNTDTYAFGFDLGHISRNLGALLCSISDMPFTDEGLLDWESEHMKECLRFMRTMSLEGLTPPNCGEGADIYDMWKRGRLAGLYSCSSRTVWAQDTLGIDKISTARIPTADGKAHSGAPFWCNSIAILNTAPLAQEAVDFLVYSVGPQNQEWQKAIIKAGTSPAYFSSYTNIIEGDPEFSAYKWMSDLRDDIQVSVPSPKNYYYLIQNEAWNQHRTNYLKDGSTMTEDELIANVMTTIRDLMKQVSESVPTLIP